MNLDKEIDSQMLLFDEYMEKWDKTPFIPVSEIIETGLFENIGEIEVFFFSFDGKYYSTDVALIKYLGRVYTDYLDKKNINRLFYY